VSLFPDWHSDHAENSFPGGAVKSALKTISCFDIQEYIERAVSITEANSRGDYHNVAAAKYLTAILRNQRRERGDLNDT